jgi:hypothetical protein
VPYAYKAARKGFLLMEKLLVQLTPEQIAPIIKHLEEQVLPNLVPDVSSYAVGRQRVWLPYEAPLSNSRAWQLGTHDPKLWQWVCHICETYAGFTPDVALVAKGGQIKPHRDTSYADYRAIGINLGPVVWGYQRQRTTYANMPQDDSAKKVEIELQGGEVFEFNSKNVHWTHNADPQRWSINAWTVKPGEQREKFMTFISRVGEPWTANELAVYRTGVCPHNLHDEDGGYHCGKCDDLAMHLFKPVSNPMTDRQVGYIRHLFKEVSTNLSDQERKNLTDKMKAHISGQEILSVDWADKAIKKLISRRKA